ncbi:MAG: hypothetical protein AB1482_12015 [Pseudomonadota bacterium]
MIEGYPASAVRLCVEFEARMYEYEPARLKLLRRYLVMLLNRSRRALLLAEQFDRGEIGPEQVLDLAGPRGY